ncbi:hypothetical protein DXG01_006396 [Tephrocybe rancida]|nr:hypothetical protein DXG01_006396 [Tephrocybe rancida]
MHTVGDIEGAARQGAEALQWVREGITDDRELESFVDGIPGFLSWADGYKTWKVASRLRGSTVWAIGNRLTVLFGGCFTSTLNCKCPSICLDALFALCLYYPRYGVSFHCFSHQITTMADRNTFAAKSLCINVMFSHPFLLSHFQYFDLPQNIHELSQQADEAVREIDDLRWRLEETLQPPSGFDDKFVIVQLLREYMDALQLAGARLSTWADIVNPYSIYLHMALVYLVRYSITLRNHSLIRSLPKSPDLCPPNTGIHPGDHLTTAPRSLTQPSQVAKRTKVSAGNSSPYSLLSMPWVSDQPRIRTMVRITQIPGPAVRPLHSQPGTSPPPLGSQKPALTSLVLSPISTSCGS